MDPATLATIFIWIGIICVAIVITGIIVKICEGIGTFTNYMGYTAF
jgi:hypothetical protein